MGPHGERRESITPDVGLARDRATMSAYYVYILTSRKHGTLYIGVRNDRAREAIEGMAAGLEDSSKENNLEWADLSPLP